MTDASSARPESLLLIGASRGLGEAMAEEFVRRGWAVVATVRGSDQKDLHDFAEAHGARLSIESVDITKPEEIIALRERLSGRTFDMLYVNAGTANHDQAQTIAEVSTSDFIHVMLTNALGVMRTVEGLQDLVRTDGTIGVMSSGQASIATNESGGHEVYRGSKAALNQYMRSYAARHKDSSRTLLLMAPGWVRTELGGSEAPLSIEESIPPLVDVVIAQQGNPGLQFLDRNGKTVPW